MINRPVGLSAAALVRGLFLIIFRDSRRGLAAGVLVTGKAVEVGAVLTVFEGTGSRLMTGIGAATRAGIDTVRWLASRVGVGLSDTGGLEDVVTTGAGFSGSGTKEMAQKSISCSFFWDTGLEKLGIRNTHQAL